MAAIGSNSKGVVGVLPDPDLASHEVGKALSSSGSSRSTSVMSAVENCVRNGAKVVSLSLGCDSCYSSILDEFYTSLYVEDDVLLVAAAGNR